MLQTATRLERQLDRDMLGKNGRLWVLAVLAAACIGVALLLPPIAQDPAYHRFADRRTWFGVPNFWNVLSNLPFVLVGSFGLARLQWSESFPARSATLVFCVGVWCVGLGSAYYHQAPSTASLVWDRLPMTVAFMALFSMVVGDRISERFGSLMLWPSVLTGAASVAYWYWSELQGRGDLRAYGLVQFLPMLLIASMLILFKNGQIRAGWMWLSLATYGLAKVAEHFDGEIYAVSGIWSGHSFKHLLASLAVLCALFAVSRGSSDKVRAFSGNDA
jgi:surface polysaccharide O-acyltransferase-like enzyme